MVDVLKIIIEAEYPIKEGWLQLGSRIQFGPTNHWLHRFCYLSNAWISFYRNEERKVKDCFGFVNLMGCEIDVKKQYPTYYARFQRCIYKITVSPYVDLG